MERIFLSSVQKELAAERRAVCDYVRGDALLGQYFDVFLFEELPAQDRRVDELYLDFVERSAVYLGIFGNEYGWEDEEGVSPTEREFDRATVKRKNRLVFVKGADDDRRHPKTRALIRKAEHQLVRRRFLDTSDLIRLVYASLIEHLEACGVLSRRPFDAASALDAALSEVDPEKLQRFLERARDERNYAVEPSLSVDRALTHLNHLDEDRPSNAAILLFGSNPQRRFPSAETKCLHFHGTEVVKPIPSYQRYRGDLFNQVDQAVDFVMAKLRRWVGTRRDGPAAPVGYEIPRAVVAEAVVNAVAHRDYTSNAGLQVYVFADRVEVWNPGELPQGLTFEQLHRQHPSIPRNPLIAEALFLAHYIEKAGTGTLDVIAGCREVGLPDPEFRQDGDQFVLTLWRDWLTEELLTEMGLSDRQQAPLMYVKAHGKITNNEMQELTGVSRKTAVRTLGGLVDAGLLLRVGEKRGTYYVLPKKWVRNGSYEPS